jgi:diamine N-acetyltransferase
MFIREATASDISIIHQLATAIWWPTYRDIISEEQIRFMLTDMYSEEALQLQMEQGYHFLIAERENIPVGFAAYSLTEPENKVYKLEKLYVLPSGQGKGTGKKLIDEVITLVAEQHGEILELNVNRQNKALHFYQKLGFEIYREADIPYHHYILTDYVMRKNI